MKKKPTTVRVNRVHRKVNEALDALGEIDSRRAVSISAPLVRAQAALTNWLNDLAKGKK